MKLIPLFLLFGMLAVSGWAQDAMPEPYSPELVKKAEAGDAEAQYCLGLSYINKDQIANEKEAAKWLTKSAEQGNAKAQFNLGALYDRGAGVTKDMKEAVTWWTKSAEQGHADAQNALGYLYEGGRGVTKDMKEAVKWWTKSAEQGNPLAKEKLAKLKDRQVRMGTSDNPKSK